MGDVSASPFTMMEVANSNGFGIKRLRDFKSLWKINRTVKNIFYLLAPDDLIQAYPTIPLLVHSKLF